MMSEKNSITSVRFTEPDLKLFGRASHDTNPLHLSESYARTTQYGQQVVFGVLGGLMCLGTIKIPSGFFVSAITFDFQSPMFIEQDYQIETSWATPQRIVTQFVDGKRVLLKGTVRLKPGEMPSLEIPDSLSTLRTEAATRDENQLEPGLIATGSYNAEPAAFAKLLERTGLSDNGFAPAQIMALLWSSYLVGMEFPGRSALFSRISLNFENNLAAKTPALLEFTATLKDFDKRFNLLKTEAELSWNKETFAKAEIWAFARRVRSISNGSDIKLKINNPEVFKGKVGLVIGASRGLGAAITQALVMQGCTVLANYHKSRDEAEKLKGSLAQASGEVILLQGDGSNLEWCEATRQQILEKYSRLDFLICNASPAILPMWFEAQTVERLNRYVSDSLSLTSVPMASFMNLLAASAGWVVVISSIYTQETPANFPHYVSAKFAIEGLVTTAAIHYEAVKFLLVRPPRLIGELNLPAGDSLILPPEEVALSLTRRLQEAGLGNRVEILQDFPL